MDIKGFEKYNWDAFVFQIDWKIMKYFLDLNLTWFYEIWIKPDLSSQCSISNLVEKELNAKNICIFHNFSTQVQFFG